MLFCCLLRVSGTSFSCQSYSIIIEQQKNQTMVNNKAFWGIVTAAAVGAVIGLLFAPDEGNKTRKKIKRKTNSLAGDLIEALERSKGQAGKAVDELKSKAEELKDEAVDAAEHYADKANKEINKDF